MFIKNYYITLIFMLFSIGIIHASENSIIISTDLCADTLTVSSKGMGDAKRHTDIEVHFKLDNSELDLNYMGNEASLGKFAAFLDSVGVEHIDSVLIISQSSPEGYHARNMKLSEGRAKSMREYLLNKHPELSGRLFVSPDGESWGRLREYVQNDTVMKKEEVEKFLSIIDADVNLETKKWRMQQQPSYKYLYKTYYPSIRNSIFHILYFTRPEKVVEKPVPPVIEEVKEEPAPVAPVDTVVTVEPSWIPRLHIKTNAIGLGMGVANLAVEVDIAKHFSFALPVYYCAWDYFKERIKFRNFSIQPEVRYWFDENNTGYFAGAHFGLSYFNIAFDRAYRYQDKDGNSPAVGGGLSFGYRMPISRNNRWNVEFALGAGVYRVHYDKFRNTPVTKDGLQINCIKEIYYGIDQAAITLSYALDLKKKGGKR